MARPRFVKRSVPNWDVQEEEQATPQLEPGQLVRVRVPMLIDRFSWVGDKDEDIRVTRSANRYDVSAHPELVVRGKPTMAGELMGIFLGYKRMRAKTTTVKVSRSHTSHTRKKLNNLWLNKPLFQFGLHLVTIDESDVIHYVIDDVEDDT